jgi:hypothetical protein
MIVPPPRQAGAQIRERMDPPPSYPISPGRFYVHAERLSVRHVDDVHAGCARRLDLPPRPSVHLDQFVPSGALVTLELRVEQSMESDRREQAKDTPDRNFGLGQGIVVESVLLPNLDGYIRSLLRANSPRTRPPRSTNPSTKTWLWGGPGTSSCAKSRWPASSARSTWLAAWRRSRILTPSAGTLP